MAKGIPPVAAENQEIGSDEFAVNVTLPAPQRETLLVVGEAGIGSMIACAAVRDKLRQKVPASA